MVTKFQIHREELDVIGGEAALREAIATFQQELKDHTKTVGVPAPTAHYFVERIVKEGRGKFEIIEPPEPEPIPEPEQSVLTFEEQRTQAYLKIQYLRQASQNGGVELRGVKVDSSMNSLTALVAAEIESRDTDKEWRTRWRVGPGAFVSFNRDDVIALIRLIREKHQRAFNKEFEWSDVILSADTPEKLASLDLTQGWE
jgi:hypothetical protein